ncbi:hypothetical protein OAT67_05235 [Bacteriovoracaceae bacterium]|nr:hypothetical protein [Bacteriovoracaceae bacterium]
MDISETGVALRLPSTYNLNRRDIVQLTVGSEYQFLNGIKAEIVCLNNVFDNEGNRFVKMALSFKKQIPEERIRIAIPLL